MDHHVKAVLASKGHYCIIPCIHPLLGQLSNYTGMDMTSHDMTCDIRWWMPHVLTILVKRFILVEKGLKLSPVTSDVPHHLLPQVRVLCAATVQLVTQGTKQAVPEHIHMYT